MSDIHTSTHDGRGGGGACKTPRIRLLEPGIYEVHLRRDRHVVWLEKKPGCSCKSYKRSQSPCIHIDALRSYILRRKRAAVTAARDWKAYDAAQTKEGRMFGELLRDLLQDVEEAPQRIGRPRYPLRDGLFIAISTVYNGFSCRRSQSLHEIPVERRQIGRLPSYAMKSRVLNEPSTNAILHRLIAATALPLISTENTAVIDSTGFRTTSFNYWNVEKHRAERKENHWLKAHVLAGSRTHVICTVELTHGSSGDAPQLPRLLARAREFGFQPSEVCADKAYSSRSNIDAISEAGARPLIPFKSNASPKSGGSPYWRKAYHLFQAQRDEFDARYHQRSNVESVFSAVKTKFDETLTSKNRLAQENELLSRFVAYNITALIQEMHKSRISVDALRPKPIAPPETS